MPTSNGVTRFRPLSEAEDALADLAASPGDRNTLATTLQGYRLAGDLAAARGLAWAAERSPLPAPARWGERFCWRRGERPNDPGGLPEWLFDRLAGSSSFLNVLTYPSPLLAWHAFLNAWRLGSTWPD